MSWAPHELGPVLACASSDGRVSVLSFKDDGSWDTVDFDAHAIGCNAVSWASAITPGALVTAAGGSPDANSVKRLATAGCDNLVKLWKWRWVDRVPGLLAFTVKANNCSVFIC